MNLRKSPRPPQTQPKTPAPIRRWQRAQIGEYGLPLQLYVDFHSFFFTHVPDALTQLGQALRFYGVSFLYAPPHQAKGKVELEHPTDIAHGIIGVVLRLREKVVEGFQFGLRLLWRYFVAHDAKGKKRFGLEMTACKRKAKRTERS